MKNISNTQNAKHSNKVTRKQKLAQGRLNWRREPSYRHRLQMHLIQLMFGGIHLCWVVLFDFYDTLLVWLGRFSVSLVNYDQLQHSGSKEKRKWELQTFGPNLRLFRAKNLRKVLFLVVSIVLACERKTDFQTWTRAKQEFDKFLFSTFPQSNFASTL